MNIFPTRRTGPSYKVSRQEKFYEDLQNLLKSNFSKEDNIIPMGDINISSEDIDIGIEKKIKKDG